jgi:hypothetical protein
MARRRCRLPRTTADFLEEEGCQILRWLEGAQDYQDSGCFIANVFTSWQLLLPYVANSAWLPRHSQLGAVEAWPQPSTSFLAFTRYICT